MSQLPRHRFRLGSASVLVYATLGCASIRTTTTVHDQAVSEQRMSTVLDETRDVRFDVGTEGTDVVMRIQETANCATDTAPIIRRVRQTAHTVEPTLGGMNPIATAIVFGGVTAGAGALAYAYADDIANSNYYRGGPLGNPNHVRGGAIAIVGLGSVAILTGIIDWIRSADSEEDLGTFRGPSRREVSSCIPPFISRTVVAQLDGQTFSAPTNPSGEIRLSMEPISLEGLPSAANPMLVYVDGRGPGRVSLPEEQLKSVLAALLVDPVSRVHQRAFAPPPVTPAPSERRDDPPPKRVEDAPEPVPDQPATEATKVRQLIATCKGKGSPGDIARAHLAYQTVDENVGDRNTKRILESEIRARCAVDRAEAKP